MGASVRPGLHLPQAGGHGVVWWDPHALDLDRQEEVGLRQQRILEADEGGENVAQDGQNPCTSILVGFLEKTLDGTALGVESHRILEAAHDVHRMGEIVDGRLTEARALQNTTQVFPVSE